MEGSAMHRRRLRPLRATALFAALRRTRALLLEHRDPALGAGAQARLSASSSVARQQPQPHTHQHQPATQQVMSASTPLAPLPSQLPTFSLELQAEEGESPFHYEGGLLLSNASSGRGPAARNAHAPLGLPPQAPAVPASSGTARVRASEVFPGRGELAAVRDKLRQESAHLEARGLGGSYRHVMQQMALAALARDELEYAVVAGGQGTAGTGPTGTKSTMPATTMAGAGDTQLGYALEALGRAVLAPAGLPRGARLLGVADDLMADIGLAVQQEAAAAAMGPH